MYVCSTEGKNGFDTEIKLGIVTRHCLSRGNEGTSGRDGGRERKEKKRERGRVEWRGGSTEKKECRARTMTREGKRYFFRSCQRG